MNVLLGLLLGGGCTDNAADTSSELPEALAEADGWGLLDDADDPFDDRDPAAGPCSPLGYGAEGTAFEVQTLDCPHGAFSQPAGHSVPAGSTVLVSAWHMDLVAAEPAEGHLAVQLGRDRAEVRPAIPGPAAAYTLQVVLTEELKAGEPVFFHVHNHGSNSWYLGELAVLPPSEAP